MIKMHMLIYFALSCFIVWARSRKKITDFLIHFYFNADQSHQFIETFTSWKSYAGYMREVKTEAHVK